MSGQVAITPRGVKLRYPTTSKPYYRLDYVLGGRRRQLSVGRDETLAWAEAMRADALLAVEDGDLGELAAEAMLEAWFEEGCTHWAETYKVGNRDLLDNHLIPAFGHVAVADLRRSHIKEAIDLGSTVRMREVIRAACSSALHWAVSQGWVQVAAPTLLPPVSRADKIAAKSQTTVVTQDEIPDFADVDALVTFMRADRQPKAKKGRVAPQEEYRSYLPLVAAYCGLRLGEVLALKGDDIDGDLLRVDEQVQFVRGQGNVLLPPKSGKSRTVVIPSQTGKWDLLGWLTGRAEQVGPGGLLFPAPRGGVWSANAFRKAAFSPARDAVWTGKTWTFHSLRHLYCTDLLSRGVAINDVAAMAGHSSPLVTASIYVNKQASTLDRVRSHLAQ